jgi:hypothetical protein
MFGGCSFDPRTIFNMDETMLEISGRKVKVLTPRWVKRAVKAKKVKESMHITLVACIAASGPPLTPTAILPLKFFPKDLSRIAGVFSWAGSSSGWINESIFLSWIKEVFLPELELRREKFGLEDQPALLWLDGHSSRNSDEALKLLEENNVFCATIPGHTSHILQPLDCGVFKAFKSAMRRERGKVNPKSAADTRYMLLTAAAKAFHMATYAPDVLRAWNTTGIWPWSPAKLLEDRSKVREMREGENYVAPRGRGPNLSGILIAAPAGDAAEDGETQLPPLVGSEDSGSGEDDGGEWDESGSGPAPLPFGEDSDETEISGDEL